STVTTGLVVSVFMPSSGWAVCRAILPNSSAPGPRRRPPTLSELYSPHGTTQGDPSKIGLPRRNATSGRDQPAARGRQLSLWRGGARRRTAERQRRPSRRDRPAIRPSGRPVDPAEPGAPLHARERNL